MSAKIEYRLMAVLVGAVAGCNGAADSPRTLGPAVVVMRPPAPLSAPQRPAVEFDHAAHTDALSADGCNRCHRRDEQQRLISKLAPPEAVADRDGFMNFYHDLCTGCHLQRAGGKTGPVTCGECHLERPPAAATARSPMRFDYSLHYRHVRAEGERCESCHHVLDPLRNQLVYRQGAEESCGACHGAEDTREQTSWRTAAHTSCVSCHLERKEQGRDFGPDRCVGCHLATARAEYLVVKDPPRLRRGQPDMTWLAAAGAGSNLVAFDHALHEPQAASCSGCHHRGLQPCKECHTLTGDQKGQGVTLESAFHHAGAERSCVGCHRKEAAHPDCTGCHSTRTKVPTERSCAVCHDGPPPAAPQVLPPTSRPSVALAPLPPASADFPEQVRIDFLADRYQPAEFPHQRVVARLDQLSRESRLATRFHQETETLCAGCHHQSPPGARPPSCRSCHDRRGVLADDRPGLLAAYHRQCLGCHLEMRLDRARDCTGCHLAKEDAR